MRHVFAPKMPTWLVLDSPFISHMVMLPLDHFKRPSYWRIANVFNVYFPRPT
jgi:hypothetical protein